MSIQEEDIKETEEKPSGIDGKDYKLHSGMRSYFQAEAQTVVENAHIFKRAEANGYQDHDLNNANFWLFNLEENLLKQTNSKLSLYDLHSAEQNLARLKPDSIDPDRLNKIQ